LYKNKITKPTLSIDSPSHNFNDYMRSTLQSFQLLTLFCIWRRALVNWEDWRLVIFVTITNIVCLFVAVNCPHVEWLRPVLDDGVVELFLPGVLACL